MKSRSSGYAFRVFIGLILATALPFLRQPNVLAQAGPGVALSTTTWTPIGPAPLYSGNANNSNVSGRIVAIAAHPTDANTIYIATAGGGVWKTTNGGSSWTPLIDGQITDSMGALAIAKTNPSIIYAGTGEANGGNDNNFGHGILISSDGGATWILSMGPSAAFDRLTTAKMPIDPTNADVAYVAFACPSLGDPFCQHTGIWKTTDRGTTWTNTTASINSTDDWMDVAINPNNVQVIYASAYTNNASIRGLYKTCCCTPAPPCVYIQKFLTIDSGPAPTTSP